MKHSDLTPSLIMHTKINGNEVAESEVMASQLLKSVARTKKEDTSSKLDAGLQRDLDQWSRTHPGIKSWHEMDKQVYHDMYKDKSMFERFKYERSDRFTLNDYHKVYQTWMERLGEFYNNIVIDVFYGVLINEMHCCACGTNSYYFSLFTGIEADTSYYTTYQSKDNIVHLSRLIAHSFSPDYEESSYCPKCKENLFHKCTKQIYKAPEVLMISFYESPLPSHLHIKIDTSGLDLNEYTFGDYQKQSVYNLRALVNREVTVSQPSTRKQAFTSLKHANVNIAGLSNASKALDESSFSELTLYCDYTRQWLKYDRHGINKLTPTNDCLTATNSVSFCLFEVGN